MSVKKIVSNTNKYLISKKLTLNQLMNLLDKDKSSYDYADVVNAFIAGIRITMKVHKCK